MTMMKRILTLASAAALLALVSCHSSDDDYYYTTGSYYGYYDFYGTPCGNLAPGCNYYADGYQIIDIEDPYWGSSYLWHAYFSWTYLQDVSESPSGIIYDIYGNALNKSDIVNTGRDIVTNKAEEEKKALKNAATFYSRKFKISQSQATKLARTLNDFSRLQNRTENDIADFTKRLYGVDFSKVKHAVEAASAGDQSALNDVMSEAASNFNITPENMKTMVKGLHGKLLEDAGIELK